MGIVNRNIRDMKRISPLCSAKFGQDRTRLGIVSVLLANINLKSVNTCSKGWNGSREGIDLLPCISQGNRVSVDASTILIHCIIDAIDNLESF